LRLDGMAVGVTLSAGAYLGGQVARSSKKADRAGASALLFAVIVVLVILAVTAIRHSDWHTGTKYILWAFIPLAIILGFTLPVQCRVKTTRSTACGNQAYGLLFGCSMAASH
jgi:putative effector of murein hydrolase